MEDTAVNWTEWAIHRILYWEEDSAKKGRLLRAVHTGVSYLILLMVVLSFTLLRALWLQTLLIGICGLVWLQHMLFHGCVFSKVEQRLLEDETSFLDPFLEFFGIEATERSKQGILMMLSTLGMGLFTLAWAGRLQSEILPLLTAQAIAVAPALHIPLTSSSLSGSLVPS